MKVCKINTHQIEIRLSHTEVIHYFENYKNLQNATAGAKLALYFLLYDILPYYEFFSNQDKITAKITAHKNKGCDITVYSNTKHTSKEYILNFKNSESLTNAILSLYKNNKFCHIKSSLYSLCGNFVLILESNHTLSHISELNIKPLNSHIYAEYVREYGKPLIYNNAVSIYGKAFLK